MKTLITKRNERRKKEEQKRKGKEMQEGGSKKQALLSQLREVLGQEHLFAGWPQPIGSRKLSAEEQSLVDQLVRLDESYDGGLARYVAKARELLQKSREGCNPLEGWIPSVPEGLKMQYGDDRFRAAERAGLQSACGLCFVLVAGGLAKGSGTVASRSPCPPKP